MTSLSVKHPQNKLLIFSFLVIFSLSRAVSAYFLIWNNFYCPLVKICTLFEGEYLVIIFKEIINQQRFLGKTTYCFFFKILYYKSASFSIFSNRRIFFYSIINFNFPENHSFSNSSDALLDLYKFDAVITSLLASYDILIL
jgi:hypothetical protein